jgi:hypothetical protein
MARSVMIKTKPKTYNIGDVIQVDAILEHPMETGLRKDKDGKTDCSMNYSRSLTLKSLVLTKNRGS